MKKKEQEGTERKVYLLVGASSDVGKEYIRYLAGGYRKNGRNRPLILAHYCNDSSGLEALATECPSVEIIPVQADLSNEEKAVALVNQVQKYAEYPNYILHFPAMKFDYMRYKKFDTDYLRMQMNVQLFSFLVITRAFLPLMQKEYGNRVLVMLTSYVDDELPPKFMADYIVTKYALLGAVKAAATEYGGKNLKINAISPCMMDTKFLDKMDIHIKELAAEKSPVGRIIRPEELAPFIDEMLDTGFTANGVNIRVDESEFEREDISE